MIEEVIKSTVREVPDFPKPGIMFKDITPLLSDANLCRQMIGEMIARFDAEHIDAIAGIESRGFLLGMGMAMELGVPFIPIRKQGKLPYRKIQQEYELEYGTATIEMHEDAIAPGTNVLIHDDLLATGGTAAATAELLSRIGVNTIGFAFVIDLTFLNGAEPLRKFSSNIVSLARY